MMYKIEVRNKERVNRQNLKVDKKKLATRHPKLAPAEKKH